MAGRKSDFTLPTNTLDDLFSTQEERDDAKLAKIRDIPLTEISYSLLCKYFRNAVLPAEPMLEANILGTRLDRCVSCGASILKKGNRKKYCDRCAVRAYKKQQAEYAHRKRAESKNRG